MGGGEIGADAVGRHIDVIVGREPELDHVLTVLESDHVTTLLLRGGVGVGKTRILREIATRANERGFHVESLTATPAADRLALAPLAHIESETDPDERRASTDLGARIARLVADLRRRAGNRPLLITVDDVHWLDDASLTLIHQLAVQALGRAVLTARSENALPPPVAELVNQDRGLLLDIAPLTEACTAELIEAILGGPARTDLRDAVWRLTRGNPLFLREVIRAGTAGGAIRKATDGRWIREGPIGVSDALVETVARRLSTLTDAAHRLATVIAVSEPLPLAAVEALDSAATLDALVRNEIVEIDGPAASVRTAHPVFCEVLVAAPEPQLRAARRRAAEALDRVNSSDPHDVIRAAQLLLDAGEVDDERFVAAARLSLELQDAQTALAFAESVSRDTTHAGLTRARALSVLGAFDQADQTFRATASDAGPQELTTITMHHARHLLMSGDPEAAMRLLEERLDRVDPTGRIELRAQMALYHFYAGRLDEAIAVSEPLMDHEAVSIQAIGAIVPAWAVSGRCAEVVTLCERVLANTQGKRLGDDALILGLPRALSSWALALMQLGRIHQSDDLLAVLGDPELAARVERSPLWQGLRASQRYLRGHLDSAAADYDAAAERLWALGTGIGVFNSILQATIEAGRGDPVKARKVLEQGKLAPPPARAGLDANIARAEAAILAAEGDIEEAIAATEDAITRFEDQSLHFTTFLHDLVRFGQPDRAFARLHSHAARAGSTWLDRVCRDHAQAAIEADPAELVAVAESFERGGLDLHAAEALAAALASAEASGESTAGIQIVLGRILRRCGRVRTPALLRTAPLLTERETLVARMAASGLSNREISERLGTSVRTIGNQLQSVYDKLDVHRREDLSARITQSVLNGEIGPSP